jgi:hypothetical protein
MYTSITVDVCNCGVLEYCLGIRSPYSDIYNYRYPRKTTSSNMEADINLISALDYTMQYR